MIRILVLESPKFTAKALLTIRLVHQGLMKAAVDDLEAILSKIEDAMREDFKTRKGWKSTVLSRVLDDGDLPHPSVATVDRTSPVQIKDEDQPGCNSAVTEVFIRLSMDEQDMKRHGSYILKTAASNIISMSKEIGAIQAL